MLKTNVFSLFLDAFLINLKNLKVVSVPLVLIPDQDFLNEHLAITLSLRNGYRFIFNIY